jgi:arsenite-transporting ATPase
MPRSLASLSSIRALVDERDLILVTGKGGTGKSTLVAVLAEVGARRRGGAVAVEFATHPRLTAMTSPGGAVEVVALDADQAVAPALSRLLGLPAVASAMLDNRALRLFIRTSPSIREMIVLDELVHIVQRASKRRAPVIVDLPATGHAMSLLATPGAVHEMVRVGPLAAVASRARALLTDASRCELLAVTLPEELPVNETIELLKRAAEIPVGSRAVVVNQMPEAPIDPADRSLLDVMATAPDDVMRRLAAAARGELAALDLARGHVDRLRLAAPEKQVIELPRVAAPDPRRCVSALVEVCCA